MKTSDAKTIFASFPGFRVYVGFSGGADSTAALLLARNAAQSVGFSLKAVHFNHHLRGAESDAEALAAEQTACALGVDFVKYDIYPVPGSGVETRARAERLKVWQSLAAGDAQSVVVLGHHLDDRVEDLLLRLGRGSNVSGAVGLRREKVVAGVRFFRPLYDWRRSEVEEFLRKNQIGFWAQDSSNFQNDTMRNLLRNRILPELYAANPACREGFAAALENLAADAAYLENLAAERMLKGDPGSVDFWRELPPPLFCRALRMFLAERGAVDVVNAAALRRFGEMVEKRTAGKVPFGGSITLCIAGNRIFVAGDTPQEKVWHWQSEPELFWGDYRFKVEKTASLPADVSADEAFFSAVQLPETLSVGAAAEGEKMVPFGAVYPVKVKKLRIDRKIPAYPVLPLLRDQHGRVLWMPFCRHSAHCQVRPGEEIIRIFGEKME